MSKITIEGKLSNWIRISIYKHVKKFKNKELLTLQRSGWILLSFMFLQTSITAFQSMLLTGIFAHEMCIKASKVSNFKQVHRWLLIRFCLEKPLSHIAVLTGITITLLHKLLKPGQLIDHYGVVHVKSQASNIWDHLSHGLHHLQTLTPTPILFFFRSLKLHKQPFQALFSNTSSLIIICWIEIGTKELACIEDA